MLLAGRFSATVLATLQCVLVYSSTMYVVSEVGSRKALTESACIEVKNNIIPEWLVLLFSMFHYYKRECRIS